MIIDRTEYYTCQCHNPTCVLAVSTNSYEEGDKDFAVYVQLSLYLPWYKRLYAAVLYIFNRPPKNYHWAETLLSDKDVQRLKLQIEEYENL